MQYIVQMPEILGKFDADIENCITWRLPPQMNTQRKGRIFGQARRVFCALEFLLD